MQQIEHTCGWCSGRLSIAFIKYLSLGTFTLLFAAPDWTYRAAIAATAYVCLFLGGAAICVVSELIHDGEAFKNRRHELPTAELLSRRR